MSDVDPPPWTVYVPESERVVAGSDTRADGLRWRYAEPTPWVLGIIVSAVTVVFGAALLVGVYSLLGSFTRWAGLIGALVVGPAICWALWEYRFRPVWRWIVWGALTGLLAGVGSSIALFALGR